MPQQSWTIGSDSSCDIVIQSSMVSGRHCRLASDGTKLTVTDLGSTNGTFVNGQRIRGFTTVSTADQITLGQNQTMPWPESLIRTGTEPRNDRSDSPMQDGKIVTIGRGADNLVVVSETNVSTNHARLIMDGNEMFLEDLGSTNGSSVGKIENKISRAVVQKSDTVFLGSTAYQVADLINRAHKNVVTSADRLTKQPKSIQTPPKYPIALVGFGIVALLVVAIGWFALRDRDVSNQESSKLTSAAPETIATNQLPQDLSPKIVGEETRTEPPEIALSDEEKLARSLFLIVCADSQRKTQFRVGTGFAIDAEHVATSATVLQAVEGLQQNGFPETFLFSPTTDTELQVLAQTVHPKFELANSEAQNAQQEHDRIFDELAAKPPKPESFEAVKDQLIAARLTALRAIDQKTGYDVAVFNVDQPLSQWLSIAESSVTLRPNQKLIVTGYAFDVEDPYLDRAAPIDVSTMSSRIDSFANSAERMVLNGTPEQIEYAYLGSPLMNAQGNVVGLYSRPTPSDPGEDSQMGSTFDAVLIERLRDCLDQRN